MNTKIIIYGLITATGLTILFVAFITDMNETHKWLLPAGLFLNLIAQLIYNPGFMLESSQTNRKNIFILVFAIIIVVLVIIFRDQIHEARENLIFSIISGLILLAAWYYDIQDKIKKHNESLSQNP